MANGVLRKDQLERSLHDEKKLIEQGVLKEDNPLDFSENFQRLCAACRRGDLKVCQEMIQEGANINAKDQFDYTPLILASLCGHYEVVQLLLESGALCERDTFQGERCLYNALNDRIRNLLLSYDYSKSTDPLQPLAFHLTSLLTRELPKTTDVTITTPTETFHLHKFILSARSPYFRSKLLSNPSTPTLSIPPSIPPPSFSLALSHLYLAALPSDPGGGPGTGFTDSEILAGVDRISKHLEIRSLSQLILDASDRRLARQRRQDEVENGRDQLESWFRSNVLKHAVVTDTSRADDIKWDRENGIFADVLLRADEDDDDNDDENDEATDGGAATTNGHRDEPTTSSLGIPLSSGPASRPASRTRRPRTSKLYPAHKAMLLRSPFFETMFSLPFRESQEGAHLPIIPLDMSPAVLEVILTFLYTERADFGLDLAVDVLFAADMLFLEKVKAKAAVVISTLGNGAAAIALPPSDTDADADADADADDGLDIYEILRAAWFTRVQRLEEFAARYIAYRLEAYIEDPAFAELVRESAGRISARQETDSIELLDDIRYYLSERFRLRFEDTGMEEAEEQALAEARGIDLSATATVNTTATDDAAAKPLPSWGSGNSNSDSPTATTGSPASGSAESSSSSSSRDGVPPRFDGGYASAEAALAAGAVRTLDGELAGDEFAADAVNYQILLGKIDVLLEQLKLDA